MVLYWFYDIVAAFGTVRLVLYNGLLALFVKYLYNYVLTGSVQLFVNWLLYNWLCDGITTENLPSA